MIKLIIFDLDGTLLDVTEKYYRSVKNALKKFGFTCPSKSNIIKLKRMNLSGAQIIDKILPKNIENRERIIKLCDRERYKLLHSKSYLKFDKPVKKVYKTLRILKNKKIKISLLSIRPHYNLTIQQLKKLSLYRYFDKIFVRNPKSKNNFNLKYKTAMKICKLFGIKYNECCIVGDSLYELEAGNKMGALTIGTTFGLSGKKILSGKCFKLISDIEKILKII